MRVQSLHGSGFCDPSTTRPVRYILQAMTASTKKTMPIPSGTPVRYIKLGQQGSWEKECLQKGIIRYGFDSGNPERFPLCIGGQWDGLMKSFDNEERNHGK